ncbi:MAG: hypothetical protein ACYTXC_12490 [Nostoc sp.]
MSIYKTRISLKPDQSIFYMLRSQLLAIALNIVLPLYKLDETKVLKNPPISVEPIVQL